MTILSNVDLGVIQLQEAFDINLNAKHGLKGANSLDNKARVLKRELVKRIRNFVVPFTLLQYGMCCMYCYKRETQTLTNLGILKLLVESNQAFICFMRE